MRLAICITLKNFPHFGGVIIILNFSKHFNLMISFLFFVLFFYILNIYENNHQISSASGSIACNSLLISLKSPSNQLFPGNEGFELHFFYFIDLDKACTCIIIFLI